MIMRGSGDLPNKSEDSYFSRAYKEFKENGATQKAVDLLMAAKSERDARAVYALASWYATGLFFKKNNRKSTSLLREAANLGHPEAMHAYAVCLENGVGTKKSEKLAFSFYTKSANTGRKEAVEDVLRHLFHGIGVPRDRNLYKLIKSSLK
jgi:uncharacterized protein